VQILNYTASGQTVDLSAYNGEAYTTYTLPDMTNHYWDADSNKTTGTVTGSVYLPAHSFAYVIMGG
jgi:hypothetical protein